MRRSVLLGAVFAAASVLATQMAIAQEKVIRVGVPFELSGRFVAFGAPGSNAVKMALDVFGGSAGGYKVEALVRDVQSEPQPTISAMTELLTTEKVKFIVGPLASTVVSAAIPVWQQNKVLWLCPGGSTTRVEEEVGKEPLFFHTYAYAYNYHTTGSRGLKQLIADKASKVAILYVDDSYGRTHLPYVEEFYTKAGFKIVAKELVRANTADMNPALTKLNLAKPDILVALLQTSDAITMAKQVYTRKMQIPYLAGTIFTELEEWQKAVGDAQEGWMGLSAFIAGLDRPASKEYPKIFPRLSEWAADFRKRYNMEPTSLAVASYTSMAMLLIAIDRAKTDDMEKVAAELRKLDIETISGRGHFEPTEHGTVNQAFSDMVLYQRQGGKNVILYPPDVKTGDIKPVVRQ